MSQDHVDDDEVLFRSVPSSDVHRVENGILQLSATAFNDPYNQPSVDRAKLCNNDPAHTKKSPSDGVVKLIAREVRQIVLARTEPNVNPSNYRVDVKSDPVAADNDSGLSENLAHALVVADPAINTGSRFKKLKEALARLASNNGWQIEQGGQAG